MPVRSRAHRRRPAVEGLESRRLLAVGINEFPLPAPNSNPSGITLGPDGNLWFTEAGSPSPSLHVPGDIGMVNPATHAITLFPIPSGSAANQITSGPDGNLWFTESVLNTSGPPTGQIGMINPTTHAIAEFPLPTAASLGGITSGPDGNLWFTENVFGSPFVGPTGSIGMIDPTTHAIAEFPLPTAASLGGITSGPDGNLWFTENVFGSPFVGPTGSIGMIDPTTHAIAEFPTPTANSSPSGITSGPDGNLWFTENVPLSGPPFGGPSGRIGMIDPATHAIAEFAIPTAAFPGGITSGPDGNLWFIESVFGPPFGGTSSGRIGMIDPATHAIAEFSTPTAASITGITSGPDGNLWFTEGAFGPTPGGPAGKVGMIDAATHAIAEIPIPSPAFSPTGIALGPDGNLWFTESGSPGSIGMIDATTHAIAEFPTPTANSSPSGITLGPDGNLWFTERISVSGPPFGGPSGQIGVINPTTHAIVEFPIPSPSFPFSPSVPTGITSGPDGNLWFTASGSSASIGMIDPTTHAIALFAVPGASSITGITSGPDGNLWFTETVSASGPFTGPAGKVGMINPATHAIAEFTVPTLASLGGITLGPDGNLWFTETVPPSGPPPVGPAGKVGMIDPTTHAIAEFPLSTPSSPGGIALGPDGNLWFTEDVPPSGPSFGDTPGRIGMINPTTHAITEFTVPTPSTLGGITAGPDGSLWFTESSGNKIGQLVLPTPTPVAVAPTVLALQRFGFHARPTTLVLSFSTALDPARAADLGDYHLVRLRGHGRPGRAIRLRAAVYDPAMRAVTLTPAHRLPLQHRFRLTVNGTAPDGLAGATGILLDGAGNGQPGSDFVREFGRDALAGSSNMAFNRVRYQWAGRGPFGGLQIAAVDALAASGQWPGVSPRDGRRAARP